MKITTILGLAFFLILPQLRAAESPAKPGPDHKKMAMGVGKWKGEKTSVETPLGPAGKSTWTEEDRMILNGFFLEVRTEGSGPEGPTATLEILAYDPDKSHYQDSFFSRTGEFDKAWKNENAIATIDGDTWNWSWVEEKKGKKYKVRQVVVFAPDRKSFSFKTSYSEDGVTWKPRDEAKATKIGDIASK
jgi:hypothetical protein